MGIACMKNISNRGESGGEITSVTAHSSKSSENLLDHILLKADRDNATTEFMKVTDDYHYGNVQ